MDSSCVVRDEVLVKLDAAARFLGLSPRNVAGKARAGVIPSVKIGKSRRFSISQLRQWIEKGGDDGKAGK